MELQDSLQQALDKVCYVAPGFQAHNLQRKERASEAAARPSGSELTVAGENRNGLGGSFSFVANRKVHKVWE